MVPLSSSLTGFGGWCLPGILVEMLGAVKGGGKSVAWKVLIVDEVTVKVMSKICKVSDIQEEGISVIEDLKKSRQPQRTLEAVYFIFPSRNSVSKFMQDMSGQLPLYKRAHVFFSTPLPPELLQLIKSSRDVLSRVASLAELNLEFWVVDTQAFVTNHDLAMRHIVGGNEMTPQYTTCIESIASRLGTMFASLKEFPAIRYRAIGAGEANPATSGRDCAPLKLATALWERLLQYKALPNYPQSESCDLIILTRAADPIAPVIHEWSYNAMCHDLLDLDGNKFKYEVTTAAGRQEQKEVLLEEHDGVWRELRDLHIADVNLRLDAKMKEFKGRNKAAQLHGGGTREDISTKDMRKIAQALPQYQDELEKLSLHIHLARLTDEEFEPVGNMRLLGANVGKKHKITLSYGSKASKAYRKEKEMREGDWQNARFFPVMEELVESLSKNTLSKDEYPYFRSPSASSDNESSSVHRSSAGSSVRSTRNWARGSGSLSPDNSIKFVIATYLMLLFPKALIGSSHGSSHASRKFGKRIFVFIIGGMTHSELSTAHKMTNALSREVIIGSTSLETPKEFLSLNCPCFHLFITLKALIYETPAFLDTHNGRETSDIGDANPDTLGQDA
ncbi:hypothetical protein AXG93_4542s1140 [Marchantia polymorpha subsp. ruderalis]|uniref:Uncharacterized protein n=1 Tax=Marchantia polymorpha subsp. ruderalis TaxID=1480154 RepID=A0A176W1W0_MARPO|nr:hypothetical protein AXG93_4542s1140 [Marchantia polymorpha subsp. ruderalis]